MEETVDRDYDFVYNHSLILETLKQYEDELLMELGKGEFFCPYYAALFMLYHTNLEKGWTHKELMHDLEEAFGDST